MKRPENAEKLCYLECMRLGWDFIGLSSDGFSDIVAWHRSSDNSYGFHTMVTYDGDEKASFSFGHYDLTFTEMCSGIINRISEMAKANIGEMKTA